MCEVRRACGREEWPKIFLAQGWYLFVRRRDRVPSPPLSRRRNKRCSSSSHRASGPIGPSSTAQLLLTQCLRHRHTVAGAGRVLGPFGEGGGSSLQLCHSSTSPGSSCWLYVESSTVGLGRPLGIRTARLKTPSACHAMRPVRSACGSQPTAVGGYPDGAQAARGGRGVYKRKQRKKGLQTNAGTTAARGPGGVLRRPEGGFAHRLVESLAAGAAADLMEVAGAQEAGLRPVKLAELREQHRADGDVDPHAQRVRAADHLQQSLCGMCGMAHASHPAPPRKPATTPATTSMTKSEARADPTKTAASTAT